MTVARGGAAGALSVLDTLEFSAALQRVAAHAAGPLGAARVVSRTPSDEPATVRETLAQVSELAARILSDDAIRAEPVPDITESLTLLGVPGSALEGPRLVEIGAALGAARIVKVELDRIAALAPRTSLLRVELAPRELEHRLKEALDPDGFVRDGASRELARARQAVRTTRQRLIAKLESLLGGLEARDRAPDAAVTVRSGRYVIPIRSTARAHLGGIVHDESASGATMFVEPPEAIELGNELRAQELQEQREVLRVLRELTDHLRPHVERVAAGWDMCIAFDDLCARARYSIDVNGFAPAITDGPVAIRNGRHPLLVSGEAVVVPFDLVLAADEWTLLVSGPNTGGKTVLIKAVGLICLMAQSGIIPPIGPDSSIPVFRQIFADIGDRQSIAESLSTFSAHVATLRGILEAAGPGSLVLIDEIGSGTDPAEGAALAEAMLLALTRRHAVTLATTHLGALKQLATRSVGIVNASLQFDAETLTPTYRLLKGVPGRSYGLAIARRLGVERGILEHAEQALSAADRTLDSLLASVEARAKALEADARSMAETTESQRRDAEILDARADALAAREREVNARARALDQSARDQTRAYLLEARKRVEDALALARAAVDEATAKEARRLVEQAIEQTDETTGEEGTGKGEGWVNLEDLKRRSGGPAGRRMERPPTAGSSAAAVSAADSAAASEVSLRGMRIDEAEALLTRALDEAILQDLPYLRVIHGKGTGAMRRMVHEMVAHDPRVRSYALAPANQGGAGVTIVEFGA
ncbi:MAG TPA: Smr/MutS family protein [Gemmatimonadales bacterium]|nr:Smr/MutS family protein [Gemmatimonadales bacterium]